MPVIVRDLDDDAATIIMVDSNLQRESLLPSERAFAYKMKLEAMKRQAGRPSKENCSQVGNDFGKKSSEVLAACLFIASSFIRYAKALSLGSRLSRCKL
jgi:ParB family chromosome partitioning protein